MPPSCVVDHELMIGGDDLLGFAEESSERRGGDDDNGVPPRFREVPLLWRGRPWQRGTGMPDDHAVARCGGCLRADQTGGQGDGEDEEEVDCSSVVHDTCHCVVAGCAILQTGLSPSRTADHFGASYHAVG